MDTLAAVEKGSDKSDNKEIPAGLKYRSQVTGHRSQVTGHRSQVKIKNTCEFAVS